eukprot:1086375_1
MFDLEHFGFNQSNLFSIQSQIPKPDWPVFELLRHKRFTMSGMKKVRQIFPYTMRGLDKPTIIGTAPHRRKIMRLYKWCLSVARANQMKKIDPWEKGIAHDSTPF